MFRGNWLVVAICGAILPMATGCGSIPQENASSNPTNNGSLTAAHANEASDSGNSSTAVGNPPPKSVRNVILAKTQIPGRTGQFLEMVDVKGQYVDNTIVGPFQGNNWTGQFQLRVVNSTGSTVSKLSLPDNKFTRLIFMRKFQFHFADYNGDGYPDFTLGQHAGSNGNWYEIFEVKAHGILQLQTKPNAQLFVSEFAYSPLFQKVKPNGFRIKYYDNSKPGWYQATYSWHNGIFKQTSVRKASSN